MRKKIIPILILILLVIGCENTRNTPTAKVENFFGKYQKMDKEIGKELDYLLEKETTLTKEQKKDYKSLLEKQYQNLSYKIVKEDTHDNYSTVDVEIQVLDYKSALDKAKDNEDKIKAMKKVNSMRKYRLQLSLIKENGYWTLNELSDEDRQKIHGLY